MKRSISLILAAVLILGVIIVLVIPHLGSSSKEKAHKDTPKAKAVTVKGAIGADKVVFFEDPKVVKRLDELGITVAFDKAGSREIATTYDLSGYDFAFPSSDTAAQRIIKTHKGSLKTPIFFSPIAVASFDPIAQLLSKQGLAKKNADGTWTLDMRAYLSASESDLRWKQIPGNTTYPVNKSVLINTADVRTSNSGAMYLALMTYIANSDNVVDQTTSKAALDKVLPLFMKQGFLSTTNDQTFNNYLVQGMGSTPFALIYESQFIERAAQDPDSMTPDMVLMYPQPTIFSQHTIITFTDGGKELVKALTTDKELRSLEISHGFRTPDAAAVRKFTAAHKMKVPAQIVDVVDAPDYDILENMIQQIEKAYKLTGSGDVDPNAPIS